MILHCRRQTLSECEPAHECQGPLFENLAMPNRMAFTALCGSDESDEQAFHHLEPTTF